MKLNISVSLYGYFVSLKLRFHMASYLAHKWLLVLFPFLLLSHVSAIEAAGDKHSECAFQANNKSRPLTVIKKLYSSEPLEKQHRLYSLLNKKYYFNDCSDVNIAANFDENIFYYFVATIAARKKRRDGYSVDRDEPNKEDLEYIVSLPFDDVYHILDEYPYSEDIAIAVCKDEKRVLPDNFYVFRGGGIYEIERIRLLVTKNYKETSTQRGGNVYGSGLYVTCFLGTAQDYAQSNVRPYSLEGFKHYPRDVDGFQKLIVLIKLKSGVVIASPENLHLSVDGLIARKQLPFITPVHPSLFVHERTNSIDPLSIKIATIKDLRAIESMDVCNDSMSYKLHIPFTNEEIRQHQLKKKEYVDDGSQTPEFFCCRSAKVYDECEDSAFSVPVCSFSLSANAHVRYFFYCFVDNLGYEVRPAVVNAYMDREDITHFHIQYWKKL